MRYMLLMTYDAVADLPPFRTWAPEDARAHVDHQRRLGEELAARGELVGGEGLARPESAKVVTGDGVDPPVVQDWPLAHPRDFLAGFWIVDVETEERALEIAGQVSAAPGPGGAPIAQPVEVRALLDPPDLEV